MVSRSSQTSPAALERLAEWSTLEGSSSASEHLQMGAGMAALDRVHPMTSLPEGMRASCIRLQGKQRDGNGGRTLCVAVRPPLCQPLIEMMKDAPAPAEEVQEILGWLHLLKKRNGDCCGQCEFWTATRPGGASPDDH